MTLPAATITDVPAPKKRGPKTPESKARSSMNALKHGLRARTFGILPEEDKAEWAQHVQDLRQGYGPVDAAEEKLVTAIAAAMWNEIRADRTLVETMAEIPPRRAGRSCGSDLKEPDNARSLGTAIRYMTAAGMATQRAQRAFFQHRKAKRDGLILPVAEPEATPANENCTNEFPAVSAPAEAMTPGSPNYTNELPPKPTLAAAAPVAADCTNDFHHAGASRHLPEPPPAGPDRATEASAPAAPLNRHQHRRLEALARQAQRRAA
jgi:hypothetical protein